MPDRPPVGTVLVVEDQPDIRELLALTLRKEGYVVVLASSAAEALGLLRAERYALVIVHHGLPDVSGMTMLRQAMAEGLLTQSRAMIITAQPEISAKSPFPVWEKPLDLSAFVDQLRRVASPHHPTTTGVEDRREGDLKAELVLYYTPPWPNSLRAYEVLLRVLKGFNPAQVSLTLCDLNQDHQTADADSIIFSPTLMKRSPSPPVWLVGVLGTGETVQELLQMCGVEESGSRPTVEGNG
jgi:CheY-like chemotaxis protein